MTNGQDVLVRGMLKPISTLRRPLESVDLATRESALAAYERSEFAWSRRLESLARRWWRWCWPAAMIEKFGGDSLARNETQLPGISWSR